MSSSLSATAGCAKFPSGNSAGFLRNGQKGKSRSKKKLEDTHSSVLRLNVLTLIVTAALAPVEATGTTLRTSSRFESAK